MAGFSSWKLPALGIVAAVAIYGGQTFAETVSVAELGQMTHIHGLAIDRLDPDHLLIATHHGLFRAGSDGKAKRVSEVQDFMGFTPHPSEPGTLYASGHPATGGNLGFIASTDNGVTWRQSSPGAGGPVDFHQMTVSPADPEVIYGAYGGLQVSRDSGRTWEMAGALPEGLIDLAASVDDADMLYAATEIGLLVSSDAGSTWTSMTEGAPVSLVEVGPDGALYAFVVGLGLVRSVDEQGDFEPVGTGWSGRILLHLAINPADPERMFAATHRGAIITSKDGGDGWESFGE